MPEIVFKSNGLKAAELFGLTTLMKGDAAMTKKRETVRLRIKETWPELEAVEPNEADEKARMETLKTVERSFTISVKEQTAIAEGALGILKNKDAMDAEKSAVYRIAKDCKFSRWLDKQAEGEVRDFSESDEAPEVESDDAPKPE